MFKRWSVFLICLVALSLLLSVRNQGCEAFDSKNDFAVLGYVPEWRYEGLDWEAVSEHVTHLILFSLEVSSDGKIKAFDRFPSPEVLEEARRHAKRLMICFGGNGRTLGFPGMVSSVEARKRFISSLVSLCDQHRLDGVDYNWEYPRGKQEWEGLARLVAETRMAFGNTGRVISLAYYPDGAQEHALVRTGIVENVDFLNMMAYDQPGAHSTMEFAQTATERGLVMLPPRKVALGLPFYGRHVTTGDWKTYEDLLKAEYHRMGPRDDQVGQYFFNGINMIQKKVKYAIDQGLGGVMIWEVGQDCLSGACGRNGSDHLQAKEHSLHHAITQAIPKTVNAARKDEL